MPAALLVQLFRNPRHKPAKRWAALVALGAKPEAAAFEVLRETLHHDDWRFRRYALEALRRHPHAAEAEADILRLLWDVDDQVRQTALKVAGELDLRSTRGAILQLLEAENPDVRDTALNTLARLWSDDDFNRVLSMYRNETKRSVRIAAAKTLRKRASRDNWRRVFEDFAHDREARHRLWSCELAAKFGTGSDLRRVEPMLRDRNRNVRLAAQRTVQTLGPWST